MNIRSVKELGTWQLRATVVLLRYRQKYQATTYDN